MGLLFSAVGEGAKNEKEGGDEEEDEAVLQHGGLIGEEEGCT